MEELLVFFESDKMLIMFTLVISTYLVMVMLLLTIRKSKRHYRKVRRDEAYNLIKNGIEEETLYDDGDIFLVYKKLVQDDYHYNSYADFLESFLIHIRKSAKKETILLISKRITPILDKEREEKPYRNINDRERRILLAIEDSFKKNETNSIKHALVDLSIVIESNQKALDKAKQVNGWSIPISIVGVLLTLFIWLYGSSLSERDVERISTQISTNISEQIIVEQFDTCFVNK